VRATAVPRWLRLSGLFLICSGDADLYTDDAELFAKTVAYALLRVVPPPELWGRQISVGCSDSLAIDAPGRRFVPPKRKTSATAIVEPYCHQHDRHVLIGTIFVLSLCCLGKELGKQKHVHAIQDRAR